MPTSNFDQQVCVLVPAFNEQQHIGQCVAEVLEAFPGARVVVVDNNSSDGTADIARKAGADVLLEGKRGKGFAVSTGMQYALNAGCTWVALHDADREYSAGHLAELVLACQAEACSEPNPLLMGVGLREVMLGQVLWRSLMANFVARVAIRIASGLRPPEDILTGARVMSAPLAGLLFPPEPSFAPYRGFELETALTRRAMGLGARMVSRGVRYAPRIVAEKKVKAWDMFGILKAAING